MNQEVDIELLINLVRLKEYLYDKGHKYYKDAVRKENAWEEIAETLNSTSEICEKIWKSLKDKYTRERKKYQPSGSCPSETPWPWYIDLNFLDEFIQQRKRNISTRNNDVSSMYKTFGDKLIVEQEVGDAEYSEGSFLSDNEVSRSYAEVSNTPCSSVRSQSPKESLMPVAKRNKTATLKKREDVETKILETLNSINAKPAVAESHFGNLVSVELSQIEDRSKRNKIKQQIMNLIYIAQ
ncbi:hypothetical protein FQR65_LT18713 [Abscondita terminalis]|nr:hypothetical protein FQR65_LT18713 [Abscondita terminalis]